MEDFAESLIKAQVAARKLHDHAEKKEWLQAQHQAELMSHCAIALEQYFDAKLREHAQTAQIGPLTHATDDEATLLANR